MPESITATVLIPCSDSIPCCEYDGRYEVECFSYGPRKWQRLAHRPGGIPDALNRLDPALVLLPLLVIAMSVAVFRLAGRVDVIHGNWSLSGLIGAVAARLRGRPSVATLRGEDVTRIDGSHVFRWMLGACLAFNDRTVVVSGRMQEALRRHFPKYANKIDFIPNGVASMGEVADHKFHSPMRILSVGSLIHRKRIETLILAVARLLPGSGVSVRIVGEGPERRSLESLASQLGVADAIDFIGSVAPGEVTHHLRWADIFVLSSESEGRPNAILEAMAAGLPVIGPDIPGVEELLYPAGGLLFPVGDADRLAECIQRFAADPDKAFEMSRESTRYIEAHGLSWRAAAIRYCALYSAVMRKRQNRPCAD